MENTFAKTSLYFVFFVTLMIAGYIVGLVTLPMPELVVAVKEKTITLIDAENITSESANGSPFQQPVSDLPELPNLPTVSVQEVNPFKEGQNVINMPSYNNQNNKNALGRDPRVTIIPQNQDNNGDAYNPMGYTSDKVEIQITGEDPLSEIEKKKLIDDLSVMTKPKINKPKNINNDNFVDPYAPRIPLIPAPQKNYYEKSNFGLLPKKPEGKKPLWQIYRNPTQINPERKPIAYILGGLGIDYNLSLQAIKTLPSQVTLGFVPYAKDLDKLMAMARKYGHETILEIPMEAHDFPRPDAGFLALKIKDSADEYKNKIDSLLSVATGYSGIMSYLGGKYILNDTVSTRLLNDLKSRGLYFVENKTMRAGILSELAKTNQVPYGSSFDILDEVLTPETISKHYSILEKNVQIGKPMIATAYLSALSLSIMQTRIMLYEKSPDGNIQLIPVSSYIQYHQ